MRPKRQAAAAAAALVKAEAEQIAAEKAAEKARVIAARAKREADRLALAQGGGRVKREHAGAHYNQYHDEKKKKGKYKSKNKGNWHTNGDERMRRSVIEQIMQLLAQCKKSSNQKQ